MENDYPVFAIRLFAAMVAGALIGLERTYHGRPAGFRTHILVATASSLLMLLTVFPPQLLTDTPLDTIRLDPTRMAQGIMTGIGFLGAGVILKENFTIRGLTTAASIWMTASIGIMIGVGMYIPALIAELISLGALAAFPWVESKIPVPLYGILMVKISSGGQTSEKDVINLISSHDITSSTISYHFEDEEFRYEMTIRTRNANKFRELSNALKSIEDVREFSIVPTG